VFLYRVQFEYGVKRWPNDENLEVMPLTGFIGTLNSNFYISLDNATFASCEAPLKKVLTLT